MAFKNTLLCYLIFFLGPPFRAAFIAHMSISFHFKSIIRIISKHKLKKHDAKLQTIKTTKFLSAQKHKAKLRSVPKTTFFLFCFSDNIDDNDDYDVTFKLFFQTKINFKTQTFFLLFMIELITSEYFCYINLENSRSSIVFFLFIY